MAKSPRPPRVETTHSSATCVAMPASRRESYLSDVLTGTRVSTASWSHQSRCQNNQKYHLHCKQQQDGFRGVSWGRAALLGCSCGTPSKGRDFDSLKEALKELVSLPPPCSASQRFVCSVHEAFSLPDYHPAPQALSCLVIGVHLPSQVFF